ncbi:hypothetical protein JHN55_07110 [Streptomyces sp. MBT56]|uniref:hypothetical protein n=1 Tax=unclassified Streptomyces TaxID=2593676 RepID=UPI00190DF641|nr:MULTISPECIES: hypothetical protein [unclassified Streptomyces]MBK3556308.1 hypothetical protein [Streptomyces sp. MBT56]MBK3601226.1 hypothetical protein [Streptomyces sp. MBT54]MBK3614538.1 hypothetical protein [Streptomyces sp. MBT98]MBK6042817.1 hypothetical protein [Streptomyces sp. MBT55]
MAQNSWPSPSYNTRAVTDAEYEQLAARFSDDGVYGDPTDAAVVSAGIGLNVDIRLGVDASVRGHAWASGTSTVTLPITANSSGQTRIDRVVLRLDRSDWTVRAVVKAGTPGAGPPPLTQDPGDTGVWEILLVGVTVQTGAGSVTVTRGELYVGTRVRPALASHRNVTPELGELAYETDTGRLSLHTGSSVWTTLYESSSEALLGAGYSSWADEGQAVGQRSGSVVSLRISKRRVGSTFNQTDADGSKLATVPASLRNTSRNQYFACVFSNGVTGRVELRTDGGMWVRMISGSVTVGHTVSLTMTYLLN